MLKNCDRCGLPVHPENSAIKYRATRLQIIEPSGIRDGHDRHLHAVDGCEGSPTSLRDTYDPRILSEKTLDDELKSIVSKLL